MMDKVEEALKKGTAAKGNAFRKRTDFLLGFTDQKRSFRTMCDVKVLPVFDSRH